MAIWGTLDTIQQQLAPSAKFDVALNYLREAFDPQSPVHARIRAIKPGDTQRVELAEGVFALEQAYAPKAAQDGRFEAHERHIDLQGIVAGDERMDVTSRTGLIVTEDALATRDVAFYADSEGASVWAVRAGEVAVFFPADVHKPSLARDGRPSQIVHKTCVKVPL